jgi:hypothetical protein
MFHLAFAILLHKSLVSFTRGWPLLSHSLMQHNLPCSFLQEMVRMDANCEQYRSLEMAYQAVQRLICLKYSNQGDDYIREALQDLKESYAAGKLT